VGGDAVNDPSNEPRVGRVDVDAILSDLERGLSRHNKDCLATVRALLERHTLAPDATTSTSIKRGDAKLPTIDRARLRGFVLELLADNGGRMPLDDLKGLAADRVTAAGCCQKMVGKWFGELLAGELVVSADGFVSIPTALSAREQAFLDVSIPGGPRDAA
jgi:hypothetical protein